MVIKITELDVSKILKKYDLGKANSIKKITGGLINHNFDVKTGGGRFVVRFIGGEFNDYKKKKFKLKFKVLEALDNKKFPYKTPTPIKNKEGKYLTGLGRKNAWVYERIEGKTISKTNPRQADELIKALATYNKFISKMKSKYKPDNYGWLFDHYATMRKVKGRKPIDKLMLKNIDFFEELLKRVLKKPFNKKIIPLHSDMHEGNVLYDGNKVVAILDFGNVKLEPRIYDVAHLVRTFCFDKGKLNLTKMKRVLKIYEKTNPLTKEERGEIVRSIILYNCIVFWWIYLDMKQDMHKRGSYFKFVLDTTRDLEKRL
jgi:homoserine kinase type II